MSRFFSVPEFHSFICSFKTRLKEWSKRITRLQAAGFPLTQDETDMFWAIQFPETDSFSIGTCGGLDPRHNTSSMLSPSLCFYKKLFYDNKKRGCIWLHVSYDLDSISYHFDFVCHKFGSKTCLSQ